MARRLLLVLLSILVLVVVVAGSALAFVSWKPDVLKPTIERLASAQLGRQVRLGGPLRLDLGRITTVDLSGLEIAAPDWAQAKNFAEIQHLRIGFDLGTYLRDRRIHLTELRIDQPRVAAERDAQGRTSWPSPPAGPAKPTQDARKSGSDGLPRIDAVSLTDGHVSYQDAKAKVQLAAEVATTEATGAGGFPGLTVDGKGKVQDDPLDLSLKIGALAALTRPSGPLPVEGHLTVAGSRIDLNGEVREPQSLRGVTLTAHVRSNDPRPLLALAGRPVNQALPPLAAGARLTREAGPFELDDLALTWGESRIEGRASYDPAPARPVIRGELRAPLLDLVPLWPVLAAGGSKEKTGNPLAVLAGYDGDLDLATGEVRLPQLTIGEMKGHLHLADDRLTVEPLRVVLPQGELSGRVATGPASDPTLAADLALDAKDVDLAATVRGVTGVAGRLAGKVRGTLRGTDLGTILAQSRLDLDASGQGIRAPYFRADEVVAQAKLDGGRLAIEPLRATLPEGRIEGRAVATSLDGTPSVDADLDVAGVQLATFLGEDKGYAGTVDGKLTAQGPAGSVAAFLNQGRLIFDGRARGLEIPQAELGAVDAKAMLEQGRLTLDPLRADLPQGRVAGRVTAGPFGDGFTADLDLAADQVDLGRIARTDTVAGVLNGKLTGTIEGKNAAEILTRSRLDLKATADQLKLPQLGERMPHATIDAGLTPGKERPLHAVVEGKVGGTPLKITAQGGAAQDLVEQRGSYPLTVDAALGNTKASADGRLDLPLKEGRFQAEVRVEGPDPGPVLNLLKLPEATLPPYRIAGQVTRSEKGIKIAELAGRLGDSDIGGNLELSLDGPRPKLSGKLHSKVLDGDDFNGLIGAEPGTGAGETASQAQKETVQAQKRDDKVVPDKKLEPARLQKFDVDLAVSADKFHYGKMPLDSFDASVTLTDGNLRVDPLVLRLGDGRIQGKVQLDARKAPAVANVEADLRRLPVARLLSRLNVNASAYGTLSGRARGGVGVSGEGLSTKQILGNADGEVTLVMQGGTIDRTIVEALGFDLLGVLGSVLNVTSDQVQLRCTLADLAIRDGIVHTRSLLVDTPVADISGDGTINLKTERIDFTLRAKPTGTPVPTDRTGISVAGTLAHPDVNINAATLAVRGATATVGALLKPFTAIIGALGNGGRDEANPCTGFLQQSGSD
ncbi:AsmA family protein [Benzoatithermus flavus]|uniref:AsmA family protein n=1 Tax=Benzoatithermus flavus TaxID=3108223 RepID=A0ABU8XLW7_9PROT